MTVHKRRRHIDYRAHPRAYVPHLPVSPYPKGVAAVTPWGHLSRNAPDAGPIIAGDAAVGGPQVRSAVDSVAPAPRIGRGVYLLPYMMAGQAVVVAVDRTGEQRAIIPVLGGEETARAAAWAALEALEAGESRPKLRAVP